MISDDDFKLFRQEMSDVSPLAHDKVTPVPTTPPPLPRQTLLDEQQVMLDLMSDTFDASEIETGEELFFFRPGIQQNTLRKLRRGFFSIDAELDLHGMTVPVAAATIAEFLIHCQAKRARCVRIIHGKGNRSKHKQPILKIKVNSWLRQRDDVLAFCSARTIDGGTGAVYILLKRGP